MKVNTINLGEILHNQLSLVSSMVPSALRLILNTHLQSTRCFPRANPLVSKFCLIEVLEFIRVLLLTTLDA